MKKYLKITFIFIMIFSMFVKSGYSSNIVIVNGIRCEDKIVSRLVKSMFTIMGNGVFEDKMKEKIFLNNSYNENSKYKDYHFTESFRVCEEIVEQFYKDKVVNKQGRMDLLMMIGTLRQEYPLRRHIKNSLQLRLKINNNRLN